MRVQFNDRNALLSQAGREHAQQKLAASLSKFGYRVNRVELTVQDNNGPKGGVDMECQVLIKLDGLGEVYASMKAETVSAAISKAIRCSERAVAKRVQRAHPLARNQRRGLGFVLNQAS